MMFNILLQSIAALLIGTTGTTENTRDQYPEASSPVIKFTDTKDKVQIYLKNGSTSTLSGEYAIPSTAGQALVIKKSNMHNVSGTLAGLNGTKGIATVSCAQNFKVSFTNDPNAYAATAATDAGNKKIILTKVDGYNANMVFAAGTGLVLYGTNDVTYTITPVSDSPTATISSNDLKGSTVHTTPAILKSLNSLQAKDAILLYSKSNKSFTSYSGAYVPQGKAYIPITVTSQGGARNISLDIVADPTALDEVNIDEIDGISNDSYDLSGRTSNDATNGIKINNGKLMIIK